MTQINRYAIEDQIEEREVLHAARVAAEINALLADGANLAVLLDDAAFLARLERAGGVIDLVTGAVHWPEEAARGETE